MNKEAFLQRKRDQAGNLKKKSGRGIKEKIIQERERRTGKKMKSRKSRFKQVLSRDQSDIEKRLMSLRLCLTITPDEDKEVDYEILDKKFPIIDWKTKNLGLKPSSDESTKIRNRRINMEYSEGFDKVFGEDLIVIFNPMNKMSFESQMQWEVVSWKLNSSSGVHTLMTYD
ncbi:hypothetical protein Tco_0779230 [Tanacetum coccineum]